MDPIIFQSIPTVYNCPYRERCKLVPGEVKGLHLCPLVNAQGQLRNLIAA